MRDTSAHAKPAKRCFSDAVQGYYILKQYMEKNYREEMVFTGIKNLIYAGTLQAFKAGVNSKEYKRELKQFLEENPRYIENTYFKTLNIIKRIYIRLIYYKLYPVCRILAFLHSYVMGK